MSTIIIINNHYKEFPLVIAANKDGGSKSSSSVQVLTTEPHLIIGAKETDNTTSIGVNKHSLFVATTSQGEFNPKLLSANLVVMDALKCKTVSELLEFGEELNPAKYNKFNLVFGNSKFVYMAHSYLLHSMVIRELPHGVHVVTSNMKFTGEMPKIQHIHGKLDGVINIPWLDYYKRIKKILASSEYGVRLRQRKDDSGRLYGSLTQSSSILAFSDSGLARYKFYDRVVIRPKKNIKEGDVVEPRYRDYVDMWRGADVGSESGMSEEEKDDVEDDEMGPKERILDVLRVGMKNYVLK